MSKKVDDKVLDSLLAECKTPADVDALYSQLLQRVINRSLEGEMDAHLGYGRNEKSESGRRSNSRNGGTTKTVKGTFGELSVTTPRDREGSFEPADSIPNRNTLFEGFSEDFVRGAPA